MVHRRASIHHILCPTDFSEFSERALRRATAMARWFGCPVTALHVIPRIPPAVVVPGPAGFAMPTIPADLLSESPDEVLAELAKTVEIYRKAGVAVHPKTAVGEPWREIESTANALPADLVVLGTHGRGGWDRFLMGSTTEKLIRRLSCPVLTVGPKDATPPSALFRRILCAVDLTASSEATMDLAFSLAEENLAQITFLHVLDGDRPDWFPPVPHMAARADFLRCARTGAIEELYRRAEGAPTFCTTDNVVREGTAWREIVAVADQIDADLIVVGAQGRGALSETFVGSTAAQTLRHASCPVLLARPPHTGAPAVSGRVA